ncbi:glycosyltransferase [Bacteroides oleiciplenus]|uniref:Glycosyl transferase family 1 domain-containing protein n=1 Tax=Bacteroides oleiciplenus YIT 12058 TaxID=742727 RepID=K9E295_9BACE|nr:glycosyltransferase [Bacteroides oleiciplenus]EKU91209.1 hypothetical protein HMPREF9447_01399 [Bacteroides oleiciplenus YIT 12058]
MKINFILSSLNDSHFLKRVQEFIDHGYDVKVFGFRRKGLPSPNVLFPMQELGEIACGNYLGRLVLFRRTIKQIAEKRLEGLFFYSSLDIALFATRYIKSPYIYEVCDLTELRIPNLLVRNWLLIQNKRVIKHSLQTIITSEGYIDFFKSIKGDKFSLIPNKVSAYCPQSLPRERRFDKHKINIGFVGVIRFQTIYNFIKIAAGKTNIIMHLFGFYAEGDLASEDMKKIVEINDNVIFHGPFKNPETLPAIYKQLDIVLCAYPPTPGIIYAEPNKLYEAIYFRCPIIVSKGTFLGRKVAQLNVGYVIDAMDEKDIEQYISSINEEDYNQKVESCEKIPQSECLNMNDGFFEKLRTLY